LLDAPKINTGLRKLKILVVVVTMLFWLPVSASVGGQSAGVSVSEFGAKPNDGIDDTEAIQRALDSGKNVFIPSGKYETSSQLKLGHRGQIVEGENKYDALIERQNPHGPILLVDLPHVTIQNLRLQYDILYDRGKIEFLRAVKNKGQGAIIFFGDTSTRTIGGKGWGTLRSLMLRNGYTGLENDHIASDSGVFSWLFENLYIRRINGHFIRINPAHSGNSGNLFNNIYLANSRNENFKIISAIDYSEGSNSVFNQLNVEAISIDCGSSAIKIKNISGIVVNGLHFEDITQCSSNKNYSSLIKLGSRSYAVFNGLYVNKLSHAKFDSLGEPTEYAVFELTSNGRAQPRLKVSELSMRNLAGRRKLKYLQSNVKSFEASKKYLLNISDRNLSPGRGLTVNMENMSIPTSLTAINSPAVFDNVYESVSYLDIRFLSMSGEYVIVKGDGEKLSKQYGRFFIE